jgi:hypothetical protein
MIIIGSRALNTYIPLSRVTEKTDYDVIMSAEEFRVWSKMFRSRIQTLLPRSPKKFKASMQGNGHTVYYEIEIAEEGDSNQFLLDNHIDTINQYSRLQGFFGEDLLVPRLPYLYLTKKSHLIYPVHFEKNIEDYHLIKNSQTMKAFKVDEISQEYYDLRRQEAVQRYGQKTPKLNVTTEDFFSSKLNVPNYFVHDNIHEMVAHFDKPIFTMMQKDSSKAWCERDLFDKLSREYQVKCVMEEAYTIALERYIIPQVDNDFIDPHEAYKRAVKRICTTLTSGWFREFAIENYKTVLEWYDKDYVKNFAVKAIQGEIKPKEEYNLLDIPLFKKLLIDAI